MIISHKNTGTLGDFANTWPLLSELSKTEGPLTLSLPNIYTKFIGLKEFLEFQDFIESVDFEDKEADIDIQAHADWGHPSVLFPIRSYYTANLIDKNIDQNLILKVFKENIPTFITEKTIIVDRTYNNILKAHHMFEGEKYYWLDFTKPLSYNINICLQSKKIITTFTGLPIILDLFNKEFDLIWFDDIDGPKCHLEHYFPERKSNLYYYRDYFKNLVDS